MEKQEAFTDVLDRLFTGEGVHLPSLYRLSDMTPAEWDEFTDRWPQQDEERRRMIVRHLADISEENFVVDFAPVFEVCLGDDSPVVRLAAIDGLWDTDRKSVIRPLIDLMRNDPDLRVRRSAAATLGHFVLLAEWGQMRQRVGDRVVEALLAQWNTEDATPVRRAVLESLGNAAHERVPALIDTAYYSDDEEMQLGAVFAMGRSADRRWVSILLEEMKHGSAEFRMEAARAAGAIGSSDAVERLVVLTDDEEMDVRLAAVHALGKIGSETAREALQKLAADPRAGNRLRNAVDEALEEIEWLGGDMNMALFDFDAGDSKAWKEDEDTIVA